MAVSVHGNTPGRFKIRTPLPTSRLDVRQRSSMVSSHGVTRMAKPPRRTPGGQVGAAASGDRVNPSGYVTAALYPEAVLLCM